MHPFLFPIVRQKDSSRTWSCVIASLSRTQMPQLTSLKINISATSRMSKAGEFCPFGILCPPLLQSVPRHACWQHYSYVSSGLYTREGVEVILGSSADVILLLFHCIVFTIDVLDLKSWSVIVFIVRLIFIGSYLPREPQEGKTEWLVLICLPFLDVKSRSLLLSCSHQLQSFLFSEVLWFFFSPPIFQSFEWCYSKEIICEM